MITLLISLLTFGAELIGAPNCSPTYNGCENAHVCPLITEVTTCGEGGIAGHTTYQLSLVTKGEARDVYTIYGNEKHPMSLPNVYQLNSLGTNIGGYPAFLYKIQPKLRYDSWLTIGISDGNYKGYISSIGIDFAKWTETRGLLVDNGAVFLIDPTLSITPTYQFLIAQITVPSNKDHRVVVNAQGNMESKRIPDWTEFGIVFNIPRVTTPPKDCAVWYDGCHTCQVNNGNLIACDKHPCEGVTKPHCISHTHPH